MMLEEAIEILEKGMINKKSITISTTASSVHLGDSFYPRLCENYDKCTSMGCPHKKPHYTPRENGNRCARYGMIYICFPVDIF